MSTNCLVTTLKSSVSDPNKEMDYFGGVLVSITRQDPSTGLSGAGVFSFHGATSLTFVDDDANFGENGEYGKTTTIVHNIKFKPVNNADPYNTPYRVFVKNPTNLDTLSNIYKMDLDKVFLYNNVLYSITSSRDTFTPELKGAVVIFHTSIDKCKPIRNINIQSISSESDIDIDFNHFVDNNVLTDVRLRLVKYHGDIAKLASTVLVRLDLGYYKDQENITGTDGVYGELNSLAAAMASRTSGTCTIAINANCHTITLNGVEKTGTVTIRFGSSMVNPTAEETAQNYQIS